MPLRKSNKLLFALKKKIILFILTEYLFDIVLEADLTSSIELN